MKKTILSMLLLGSSCAIFAQTEQTRDTTVNPTNTPTSTQTQNTSANTMNSTTPDDKTTLKSTGNYSAYNAVVNVPPSIRTSFETANPGMADVRWEQNNDWYRATYTTGGRRMRMMYDMRGNSFAVALPVTQGLIPEEVIQKAYTLYGDNIYDITRLKKTNAAWERHDAMKANAAMMNSTMPANGTTSMNTTTTTTGAPATTSTTTNPANATTGTPTNGTTSMNSANATLGSTTMTVQGDIYQIRIIENGEMRTERMNEDGTPYTEAYYRPVEVETDPNTMNTEGQNNLNNNNNQNTNQQPTTTDSSYSNTNSNLNSTNTTTTDATTSGTTNTDKTSDPNKSSTTSDTTKPVGNTTNNKTDTTKPSGVKKDQ